MLRKLKLWWWGKQIRHYEALFDEATAARNVAISVRNDALDRIQMLKARAMSAIVTR